MYDYYRNSCSVKNFEIVFLHSKIRHANVIRCKNKSLLWKMCHSICDMWDIFFLMNLTAIRCVSGRQRHSHNNRPSNIISLYDLYEMIKLDECLWLHFSIEVKMVHCMPGRVSILKQKWKSRSIHFNGIIPMETVHMTVVIKMPFSWLACWSCSQHVRL